MQKYRKQNSTCWKNNYLSNEFAYNKRTAKRSIKNVKLISIFAVFIILLVILSSFNHFAYANTKTEDQQNIENDLLEEIDNQLDKLELTDLENFLKSVEQNVGKLFDSSPKELMEKLMKGEFILDFNSFMNFIFTKIKDIFRKYFPVIFFIVFISVLSSVLNGLTSNFINRSTNDIINLVCEFSIVVVLFTALNGILVDVKNTVFMMKQLMEISFPIILTLMVAMGGVTSGLMYKPMMLILSNVIVSAIVNIIIPFFIAGIVLSVVGNMSNAVKINKLPKFFVSSSSWILGALFSVFSVLLSLKGITGVMVDNVSVNVTKFCLSSYVPVLGGYVSDGFDLVLASLLLIKNSFGITVLIILVLTISVPILKVLFFMFSIKLIVAVIEPIADSKICKMLDSISETLLMLIASLIGLAFMFFILMMLIIKTINFA